MHASALAHVVGCDWWSGLAVAASGWHLLLLIAHNIALNAQLPYLHHKGAHHHTPGIRLKNPSKTILRFLVRYDASCSYLKRKKGCTNCSTGMKDAADSLLTQELC